MPPTTSRDFQRAAAQRLNAAETLLREKLTLNAQYLGGYATECSLKALILELTPDSKKADKLREITAGAKMHRPEILLGELANSWSRTSTPACQASAAIPLDDGLEVRDRTSGYGRNHRLTKNGESNIRMGGATTGMTQTANCSWEARPHGPDPHGRTSPEGGGVREGRRVSL